jgi:hypothetical protein
MRELHAPRIAPWCCLNLSPDGLPFTSISISLSDFCRANKWRLLFTVSENRKLERSHVGLQAVFTFT